jgi:uncharacterized protein YggE
MNAKRTVIATATLAAVLLLAAACGDNTTIQQADKPDAGITVSGEGRVTAPPDLARLSLGVSALAPSVAEAREQAAASLSAMIQSLKDNGVADKDIQTQQLSIYPEYSYDNGQQTLRGFRVTNTVDVKIRDIDRTGEVVDDAVAAGGNTTTINGLFFSIEDPTSLQDEARKKAVEDARARAEIIADAAGVDLGDPISISESGGPVPLPEFGRGAAAPAADTGTPIQTGELDVVINVSVTFKLD